MNKKKTGILLSVLGVVSLMLITAGVTYAFFSYSKEGEQSNSISAGSITFRYNETSNGLALTNALPMSDSDGITKTTRNDNPEAFTFTVTSSTPSSANIPYVVSVRNTGATTLENQVKIYLTESGTTDGTSYNVSGVNTNFTAPNNKTYTTSGNPSVTTVNTYSALSSTSQFAWYNTAVNNTDRANDKIVYEGIVPASANGVNAYSKAFKLGMWLTNDTSTMADYSPYEFVLSSQVSGTTVTVSSLSRSATPKQILTSTEYYALSSSDRANYERIAYVNYSEGKVITRSQAVTAGYATNTDGVFSYTSGNDVSVTIGEAPNSVTYTADEQYYPLQGTGFTVKVNVLAEGATVVQ